MIATLRLIMGLLSIIGALSIVCSAVYRKTVFNPKVHPIFVLSVADTLLSVLWISGAVLWLTGGLSGYNKPRVRCFSIYCMTVILQCVSMNVTLIYALLAYFSIKQRALNGVYMVPQRPVSIHVWPPLCSFTAYLIAWILPVPLTMIPFGVIAQQYKIVEKANNCSCWCLPNYGNIIPRPQLEATNGHAGNEYLHHLHYLLTFYSALLILNFATVLCCMAVIYYKVLRQIKRMMLTQGNSENTPLYGATRAMILAGQKDAKKRVFLFLTIYVITGFMIMYYGVVNIIIFNFEPSLTDKRNFNTNEEVNFYYLLLEALLAPSQGFLNAAAYGWTRGDFLSVMSRRRHNRELPDSTNTSYGAMEEEEEEKEEETDVESEREEGEGRLLLDSRERRQRGNTALTPVSPGGLLGDV
ncbi:hypothetical protein GBAR_LOCUS15900 [Geodia barretti]|uniref:G-protein coupled receptors family 1 profile domain-containing protein n=3 Tax=Geodia barretti TaxID=519541 RepID=A0AA35SEY6_GEOBA|nr:hypothetical protein GBAR_LOCUS15900 [Geodia barretti]